MSEELLAALARPPHDLGNATPAVTADPLADEDLQLALYVCYELHYRGFDDVADRWEWQPSVLALRGCLETQFECALDHLVADVTEGVAPEAADTALREILDADDGPSLSMFLADQGTAEQLREFMVHRSAYQLKEADPHTWAIPRLTGRPKAAMVEIQADEYGGGRPERIHATMFARSMEAIDLDSEYGAYVDYIPGLTLATVNLVSLFGLHRRLRGCLVGHLALFEMGSSIPSRRLADALHRHGWDEATDFFDEHVEADAVHENIAAVDLAGGLMAQDARISTDVLFGARALAALDRRFADHLFGCWEAEQSSLRRPLAPAVAV